MYSLIDILSLKKLCNSRSIIMCKSLDNSSVSGFTHLTKRKSARTGIPSENIHCFLDRYRIDLAEHRVYKRNKLNLCVSCGLDITVNEAVDHRRCQLRKNIRDD